MRDVPWSLRRQADGVIRGLGATSTLGGTVPRDDEGRLSTWNWLLVLAFVLAVMLAPVRISGPFADNDHAVAFLGLLWTVQAAVLALSTAVIVFALQALAQAQPAGSFAELVADSRLAYFVHSGVIGLIAILLTLLGFGYGGPNGWSGMVAIGAAAASLPGLSLVFEGTLRAIDPDYLYTRRLRRLSNIIKREVGLEARERVALGLLRQYCERFGIDFQPVGIPNPAPRLPVPASRDGSVRDIRLRSLARLGLGASQGDESNRPTLSARIGQRVHKGDLVMELPDVHDRVRGTKRISKSIVRVFVRLDADRFADAIDRLHAEALDSIRDLRPTQYARTADAYRELLLTFPEAWASLHVDFTADVANSISPFGRSGIDQVMANLYQELESALNSPSRELASTFLDMCQGVAMRAARLRADGLLRRMTRLLVDAIQIAKRSPQSPATDITLAVAWRKVFEIVDFSLARSLRDEAAPMPEREAASVMLVSTYLVINELVRGLLEGRDLPTIELADDRWGRVLQFWHPDHTRPFPGELEAAERDLRPDDPAVVELRQKHADNLRLISIRDQVVGLQETCNYGLTFWALHLYERDRGDDAWIRIFDYFAAKWPSPAAIVDIATRAMAAEEADSVDWGSWVLAELPEGRVHMVGVDRLIMRTALVLLLLTLRGPEQQTLQIESTKWIADRLPELVRLADEIAQTPALVRLVNPEALDQRTEALKAGLKASAEAYARHRRAAVREEALDQPRVEEFCQALRDGWTNSRVVPSLFRAAGCYLDEAPLPQEVEDYWFGLSEYLPKDMLVASSNVIGSAGVGGQLGERLADGEFETLLRLIARGPKVVVPGPDRPAFRERFQRSVAQMVADGYHPTVVITPISMNVERALGLERAFGPLEPPPIEWQLPAGAGHLYRGSIDGVGVLSWYRSPPDRMWLVDVGRLGRWHQFELSEGGTLRMQLETFTVPEARTLVRQHRALFRDSATAKIADRADRLREHTLLRVRERVQLEITDARAARWIELPMSLRR